METLVITQKVQVKRQKIKCITNITACEHNEKCEISRNKTKFNNNKSLFKDSKTFCTERVVPLCLRTECRSTNHAKNDYSVKERTNYRQRIKTETKVKSKETKHDKYRKERKSKYRHYCDKHKHLKEKSIKKFSDLKRSKHKRIKVKQDNISYSLASSLRDRFNTLSEILSMDLESITSDSDIELDTLIKRSKEREKRTGNREWQYNKNYRTTPIVIDNESVIAISSDDDIVSLNDSIHSASTLVLEHIGSPIIGPEHTVDAGAKINNNDPILFSPVSESDEEGEYLRNDRNEIIEFADFNYKTLTVTDKILSPVNSALHTQAFHENNFIEQKYDISQVTNEVDYVDHTDNETLGIYHIPGHIGESIDKKNIKLEKDGTDNNEKLLIEEDKIKLEIKTE